MATGGRKGGKKTGGRTKGTPNKLTTTVREAFQNAFNELQKDKENNLLSFAKNNPHTFYQLASKLIPTELAGNINSNLIIVSVPEN